MFMCSVNLSSVIDLDFFWKQSFLGQIYIINLDHYQIDLT